MARVLHLRKNHVEAERKTKEQWLERERERESESCNKQLSPVGVTPINQRRRKREREREGENHVQLYPSLLLITCLLPAEVPFPLNFLIL
jgi:hypothetical protein